MRIEMAALNPVPAGRADDVTEGIARAATTGGFWFIRPFTRRLLEAVARS